MELEDKTPTKNISKAMRQLGENTVGRHAKEEWISCLQAAVRLDELQNCIDEMYKKVKALESASPPQATYDRLLIRLMKRKTSLYRGIAT